MIEDFVDICIEENITEDIEELEISDMLDVIDEKLSIAKAIKVKKQKARRMKTSAGKLAKKKLDRKTSRSSYVPNKKRSRSQKRAHKRVRRKIPKAMG